MQIQFLIKRIIFAMQDGHVGQITCRGAPYESDAPYNPAPLATASENELPTIADACIQLLLDQTGPEIEVDGLLLVGNDGIVDFASGRSRDRWLPAVG